jgi:hypothetical protein
MVARHEMPGEGQTRPVSAEADVMGGAKLCPPSGAIAPSPTAHTLPCGTGFWMEHSRHFMPGYHRLVPSGQKPTRYFRVLALAGPR